MTTHRLRPAVLAVLVAVASAHALSGCFQPSSLGFPGPYAASAYHETYGEEALPLTVFYPDTDPPRRNLPTVIFTPGFIQPRASYESYGWQLAQWGFVVVIRAYPSLGFGGIGDALIDDHVIECGRIIDWLVEENRREDSRLFGMIDETRFGVAGHSVGASVSIATAVTDPRIDAMVALDVVYDGADLDVLGALPDTQAAMMYIRGDAGGLCGRSPFATVPLIDYSPPPSIEVTIRGADHMDFLDGLIGLYDLGYGIVSLCSDGPADDEWVRAMATKYMVAWFNVHLKGQDEFRDYYEGDRADEDVAADAVDFVRALD